MRDFRKTLKRVASEDMTPETAYAIVTLEINFNGHVFAPSITKKDALNDFLTECEEKGNILEAFKASYKKYFKDSDAFDDAVSPEDVAKDFMDDYNHTKGSMTAEQAIDKANQIVNSAS